MQLALNFRERHFYHNLGIGVLVLMGWISCDTAFGSSWARVDTTSTSGGGGTQKSFVYWDHSETAGVTVSFTSSLCGSTTCDKCASTGSAMVAMYSFAFITTVLQLAFLVCRWIDANLPLDKEKALLAEFGCSVASVVLTLIGILCFGGGCYNALSDNTPAGTSQNIVPTGLTWQCIGLICLVAAAGMTYVMKETPELHSPTGKSSSASSRPKPKPAEQQRQSQPAEEQGARADV